MKTTRKLLSLALAFILAFSCLSGAFAAEGEECIVTYETPERTYKHTTENRCDEIGHDINVKSYDLYKFFDEWSGERFDFWTHEQRAIACTQPGRIVFNGFSQVFSVDTPLYAVYAVLERYTLYVKHDFSQPTNTKLEEGDEDCYALVGRKTASDGSINQYSYVALKNDLTCAEMTADNCKEGFTYDNSDINFCFHKTQSPAGKTAYLIYDPNSMRHLLYNRENGTVVWGYGPQDEDDFWNIKAHKDGTIEIYNSVYTGRQIGYNPEKGVFALFDLNTFPDPELPERYNIYCYLRTMNGEREIGFTTEVPLPNHISKFNDCNDGWYDEAINYAVSNGLMGGDGPDTFSPGGSLTRAMMVTVLYRAAGGKKVEYPSSFKDVPKDEWYSDAIAWAEKANIVGGTGNGNFSPNDSIKREDIATILYRYEMQPEAVRDLSGFKDVASIDGYALKAMEWAVRAGLMKGDNGCLKPTAFATRAEFATMMMRWQNGHYKVASVG